MKKFLKFPENFLWGASISAHQTEGNNIHNDWWKYEEAGVLRDKNRSGIAVDFRNRYKEDLDIAESLNFNIFRTSIEWARVEPHEGVYDQEEIDYYRDLFKEIKKRGMKVMLTLQHFSVPQWFEAKGAFEKKENVKFFVKWAEKVMDEFGDDIDFIITINEPSTYTFNGYLTGEYPPLKKSFILAYRVYNNIVRAHNQAYEAIKAKKPTLPISYSQNVVYFQTLRKNFFESIMVNILDYLSNRFIMLRVMKHLDFIAIQFYNRVQIEFTSKGKYLGFFNAWGILDVQKNTKWVTDFQWEVFPQGLLFLLLSYKILNKPIIITENGIADSEDKTRARFIQKHLQSIYRAIKLGVDVKGYIHWSLMDNYEWSFGYQPQFGLVRIDRENNLKRTIRDSAKRYAEICKNNGLTI